MGCFFLLDDGLCIGLSCPSWLSRIRILSEDLGEKLGCLATCTHEKGVLHVVQPNPWDLSLEVEGQSSSSRVSFCWPLSFFQGGVGQLSRGFRRSWVCWPNDITPLTVILFNSDHNLIQWYYSLHLTDEETKAKHVSNLSMVTANKEVVLGPDRSWFK